MITVLILKDWNYPDLMRQTPKTAGVWDGVRFTFDSRKSYDYVIVCNGLAKPLSVNVAKNHLWCLIQEPPNEYFNYFYKTLPSKYGQVYGPFRNRVTDNTILTQPCLPWHVDKSYDELIKFTSVPKTKTLSWITSGKKVYSGHKKRFQFLDLLKKSRMKFDLFGRDLTFIKDKWIGLVDYRYSLAVENYSGPHYWSEKIADCYLSFSMPIYYGCTNLEDYFPKESYIKIDINNPNAIDIIENAIQNNSWKKNYEAIVEARKRVLNRYQFFPYISRKIKIFNKSKAAFSNGSKQSIVPSFKLNFFEKVRYVLKNQYE